MKNSFSILAFLSICFVAVLGAVDSDGAELLGSSRLLRAGWKNRLNGLMKGWKNNGLGKVGRQTQKKCINSCTNAPKCLKACLKIKDLAEMSTCAQGCGATLPVVKCYLAKCNPPPAGGGFKNRGKCFRGCTAPTRKCYTACVKSESN